MKTAIEAEVTGYEFYKNAAKATDDPMGKETFSRMAEEEMGHFNYLRHQYESVLKFNLPHTPGTPIHFIFKGSLASTGKN